MSGRAYSQIFRLDSAYGNTYTRRDVSFYRGAQNDVFYQPDPINLIRDELRNKGWTTANTKYVVFGDVKSQSNSLGQGKVGDAWAVVYRRYNLNGQGRAQRWGCGDDGDAAVMQEVLHTFGHVASGAAEYDSSRNDYHTTKVNDVMYGYNTTAFSGQHSGGSTVPVTIWDDGEDSYTTAALNDSSWLSAYSSTLSLNTC